MEEKARNKSVKQRVCWALIAVQIWQPFFNISYAGGVAPVNSSTGINQSANGVPVVDIAKPGAAGISHNSYTQFDVTSKGLILNNSAQAVNTQLGGYVMGNANVAAGSARLILNEVTTANPSRLEGYMEVAGQKADVIVANPYGITCRGCGFINTAKATLSTGKPFFNSDGSLGGFDVQGGVLHIDGTGLNASNTERLALYTRVLELNAALYAKDLQILAGSNRINTDGSYVSITSPVLEPTYSIDSSALGGMYANTISLLGTDAGLGMRLSGPVTALTGKLEISSKGDVRLVSASAAQTADINTEGSLGIYSNGDDERDGLAAGGMVKLAVGGKLTLAEGISVTGAATEISAATVDTAADSELAVRGNLVVHAETQNYLGNVGSEGTMTLSGQQIDNHGQLLAAKDLTITAMQLTNRGRLQSQQGNAALTLSGELDNRNGDLQSGGALNLKASSINNAQGRLISTDFLDIDLVNGPLDNSMGLLQGNAGLNVKSKLLDNRGGGIASNGAVALNLTQGVDNRDGRIDAVGKLTLTQDVVLQNENGALRSAGDMSLYLPVFDQVQSGGVIAADGWLSLFATSDIVLNAESLNAPGSLLLQSSQGNIAINSRVASAGDAVLRGQKIRVEAAGLLAVQGNFTAQAESLDNDGIIFGRDSATLLIRDNLNNGSENSTASASILSTGDIIIRRADGGALNELTNYGSQIESLNGSIQIEARGVRNINLAWAVSTSILPSVYTYSPNKTEWANFYGIGISSTSGLHAYRYQRTTTHYSAASEGLRGNIIAGQDIIIDADTVENDRSTISAGHVLDINADAIFNTGTELIDKIEVKKSDRWHICTDHSTRGTTCNNYENKSTLPAESGATITVKSILEGQSVSLHGVVVSCSPGAGEDPGSKCTAESVSQTGRMSGPWNDLTPPAPVEAVTVGNLPGLLDPTALPGFHLPGNGIFHINPPGHSYLVETDPALNTYTGFLGSGYLIGQLSWQPGITQRRLGDSYYELLLIRDSLLASIGSRFLDPLIADEKSQYEYLMQNAIAASEALQLTAGISLSREQINALQQDIVWMEERNIAGEKVLVPVVYLAQGSSRLVSNGAVIGGGSLVITGDSFSNNGIVQANDRLDVSVTGDLRNVGGTFKAKGDITLQSGADILNESGHIRADNILLQAGGDITSKTWSGQRQYQDGAMASWATDMGDIASIQAKSSLVQQAEGDIRLSGARLGGDTVSLMAAGNIVLETVKAEQGRHFTSADWQMAEEHVRHLSSQIEASQGISIQAGQDIMAIAASIKAGGNMALAAGGNISLLAAEETDHHEEHSQQKGSFSKKTYDSVDDSSRMQGSYLEAKGNLIIKAETGNVLLYASQAKAGQQADISAAGDVSLIAGVETVQHSVTTSKSNAATFKNHQEGFIEQTAAGSAVMAGGNLNISAGRDVNVMASVLSSDASMRIGGAEVEQRSLRSMDGTPLNLNVGTLALTNESWNETQKGFSGPLESLVKVVSFAAGLQLMAFTGGQMELPEITIAEHDNSRSSETRQAGSSLHAQEDMRITVKEAAAFSGTDVAVGKSLTIGARDIVIDAVAETSTQSHSVGKDSVKGLGAELDKDKGEYSLGGVQETKTSITDTQSVTQWRGSSINAGQLILEAENNIDIMGSQLNVAGDAIIKAGGDLTIGGREGSIAQEHKETTEVITISAAVRNAYVDAVQAVQGLGNAKDALKDAKGALSEAEAKVNAGQLDEGDLNYFRSNLAAAAVNLAQAEVASASAIMAIKSAPTYGFYATGSVSRDKTTTTSTSTQTVWQGSALNISGNAALTAGEKIKVQGSDVVVRDALFLSANKIELLAGEERSQEANRTIQEHEGGQISVNANGLSGGSANVGLHESDADSSSTHYVNSHLNAGSIMSQSHSMLVAGAVVEADDVSIDTKTLTVVSLQDESRSQSKSQGGNAGVGFGQVSVSSLSGSVDYQKSEAERKWVTEQSAIIGHNSARITAQDTTLTGGLIANAIRGESGELIDQGGLHLSTETLTINNLYDIDKSKTVGGSFGLSRSRVPADQSKGTESNEPLKNGQAGKKLVPHNTTTVGATYYGHDTEQTTQATLGGGTIVVGGKILDASSADELRLSGLNRDVGRAQVITRNEDIGGLSTTVTIDNRLFSPEGLHEMAQEQKGALGLLLKGTGQVVAVGGALLTGEGVEVAANASDALRGESKHINKNARSAATVGAYQDDEYHNLSAIQGSIQDLANAMGGNADVRLVEDLASQQKDAAFDPGSKTIYLDIGSKSGAIFSVGHEIGHAIGGPNSEPFADTMGLATQLTWWGSSLINADAMKASRPSDINLFGSASSQGLSNASLLSQNDQHLQQNQADHGDVFLFRDIYQLKSSNGSTTFSDSYQSGDSPLVYEFGKGAVEAPSVATTVSRLNSPEQILIAERQQADQAAINHIIGTPERCAQLQNCVSFDPESEAARSVMGFSTMTSNGPADNIYDVSGTTDLQTRWQAQQSVLDDANTGFSIFADLTAGKGLYDLNSWIFGTDTTTKIQDVKTVYDVATDHPLLAGGLILLGDGIARNSSDDLLGDAARLEAGGGVTSSFDELVGPPPRSPVEVAQSFQGSPKFPGLDQFREVTIRKGTVLYAGEPGFSGFFTTESGFLRSGGDATRLFEGLQVPPRVSASGVSEFRPGVGAFVVTEDVTAAFGIVRANPQYGAGGLPQVVIPNWTNVTRQMYSVPLRP
ncbi:MAG: hemagglutinin repeat-containing protein [Moraxellaceae bacterium]